MYSYYYSFAIHTQAAEMEEQNTFEKYAKLEEKEKKTNYLLEKVSSEWMGSIKFIDVPILICVVYATLAVDGICAAELIVICVLLCYLQNNFSKCSMQGLATVISGFFAAE